MARLRPGSASPCPDWSLTERPTLPRTDALLTPSLPPLSVISFIRSHRSLSTLSHPKCTSPLRAPERPCPVYPRVSALRIQSILPLCTPMRPSACHHSAPLHTPAHPRKSCRATPQPPACPRCLRRLLERDFDPRGRQAHPRSTAQPQPPGYLGVSGETEAWAWGQAVPASTG